MASRAGATKSIDKLAVLRNDALFGQLDTDTLTRLASYAHTKFVSGGTRIFEKGDPGTSLFAVLRGTVRISNQSADGKDAVLNMISAGGIFGEIALLDGQRPYSRRVRRRRLRADADRPARFRAAAYAKPGDRTQTD